MQAKIYLALAGRLVTLLTPRGRSKGEKTFLFGRNFCAFLFRFYGLYRNYLMSRTSQDVWGLKIGFRGVIFPGSGCIYLEIVQYSCFYLKIPEIVTEIYIGTVQTSARENI